MDDQSEAAVAEELFDEDTGEETPMSKRRDEDAEPGEDDDEPADGDLDDDELDDDELDDDEPGDDEESGSGEAETVRDWLGGATLSRVAHVFLGFVVPAVVALVNMWRVRSFTVDDAYISYRYARNLARGWGLVYNYGERIEGYTNFLWTVILGGAIKLGVDPDIAAKVLGALFACGSLGVVFLIEERIRPLKAMPVVSTWLLATTMVFAGYSVWGLETSMFVFLVLSGTWLVMREEDDRPVVAAAAPAWKRAAKRAPWSGLLFGLAGITRPEAPMYLGVLMFFLPGASLLYVRRLAGDAKRRDGSAPALMILVFALVGLSAAIVVPKELAPGAETALFGLIGLLAIVMLSQLPRALFAPRNLIRGGLFLAPVVSHFLWRKSYYGSWLPNTLSAKTGDVRQQLAGGLDYVEKFIVHGGPVVYLVCFGVAAGFAWRHRWVLAFACLTLLGATYVVLVGGDWMPIYRFMAPVQPFLFLLIGLATRVLVEKQSKLVNYGLLVLALVTVGHRANRLNRDRVKIIKKEKKFWDSAAGGTARWFAEKRDERGVEATYGTIAMGDIGEIGYRTDYPVLDLLGLVDPVVSELPGGYTRKIGKGYRDHFFNSKPRYFVLVSADNDCHHPSVPGSRVLYTDRRFLRQYFVSGRVKLMSGFSWCVYERKDAPHANEPLAGEQKRKGKPRGMVGPR